MDVASPFVPPTGLLTPAQSSVASRRRRAAKEDTAAKQVYGTRRSARLAEKSGKLQRGVTGFSKKDLFTTGGGEGFKMNLEESMDGMSEVSGVTAAEESMIKDEGQVDSCEKQAVSTDVEQAPIVEEEVSNPSEIEGSLSGITGTEESVSKDEGQVDSGDKKAVSTDIEQDPGVEEEVRNHYEDDGSESRVKEGVDEKMSVEVKFDGKDGLKAEGVKLVADIDHYPTGVDSKMELNESMAAEFEQGDSVTEEFGDCSDTTKASHDETLVLALPVNSNDEALKADESHAIETSEAEITRIDAEKMEEKTAEDAESVEVDYAIAEVSLNTFIQSDDEELSDADSNPREVVASDENEDNLELNSDSSETESDPDESDSDSYDLSDESTNSNASLSCMSPEISFMSDEDVASDWDEISDMDVSKSAKQDVAADVETETAQFATKVKAKLDVAVEDHPTHQLDTFKENEANTSFTFQPAFSTPKRASASKVPYSRMNRAAAASDNKENVGNGSKSAPAKAKSKMVNESLLSKNFKDLAIITQNLDKSEGENGVNSLS